VTGRKKKRPEGKKVDRHSNRKKQRENEYRGKFTGACGGRPAKTKKGKEKQEGGGALVVRDAKKKVEEGRQGSLTTQAEDILSDGGKVLREGEETLRNEQK